MGYSIANVPLDVWNLVKSFWDEKKHEMHLEQFVSLSSSLLWVLSFLPLIVFGFFTTFFSFSFLFSFLF
jgi:hypothetical protein